MQRRSVQGRGDGHGDCAAAAEKSCWHPGTTATHDNTQYTHPVQGVINVAASLGEAPPKPPTPPSPKNLWFGMEVPTWFDMGVAAAAPAPAVSAESVRVVMKGGG